MCRKREADLNQIVLITQQEADEIVGFLRLGTHPMRVQFSDIVG